MDPIPGIPWKRAARGAPPDAEVLKPLFFRIGKASFTASSDIRRKENVTQVGVSPQGYKIYEFNYIGGDVRFRGAMAQDVVQKNPMAVGIDQNYLTVDYSKIDVNMEVV